MGSKVIYHCYGGSHSSVTAAGIHLGLLPRDRIASAEELLKLPHFDAVEKIVHGHFRYIGRTCSETEVYALGKKTLGNGVSALLENLAKIAGCSARVYAVDTTAPVNPLMVVGGFLSRRLRLVAVGRPLVVYGTQLAYWSLFNIVKGVEDSLEKKEGIEQAEGRDGFKFKRAIFYVCPQIFRTGLVLAGFCLNPDLDEEGVLKWLEQQEFYGGIGDVSLLGHWGEYDVYIVGAEGEPEIVFRILKEFRRMVGIPSSYWSVMRAPRAGNLLYWFFAKVFKIFRFWRGVHLCERLALRKMLGGLKKEAYRVRVLLNEGILD